MSSNECTFCKKVFSTSKNLHYHQSNAKYCLALRGETGAIECNHCNKQFSSHQRLQYHIDHHCPLKEQREAEQKHQNEIESMQNKLNESEQKHQNELESMQTKLHESEQKHQNELESMQNKLNESEQNHQSELAVLTQKIEANMITISALQNTIHNKDIQIARLEGKTENADKLQDTIVDIAKQPKTNHNNNTNNTTHQNIMINTLDLDDTDHVGTVLKKHMTKEVLYKGQEGVAMLVDKNLLRDKDGNHMYVCTDTSRHRYEYPDKNGKLTVDPKANKLITSLTAAKLCQTFHDAASQYYYKENGMINDEEMLRLQEPVHEVMNIQKDSRKFRSKLSVLTAK